MGSRRGRLEGVSKGPPWLMALSVERERERERKREIESERERNTVGARREGE